jgi:hypothetical protein
MTQLSPNTSVYAKALSKLKEVNEQFTEGDLPNPEDYYAALQNILHEIYSEGERPNLFYDFIEHGEPALSKEINRFWRSMSSDVNIIYDQVNYLKAHVLSTYNNTLTDIRKSVNENARLKGKLKTLKLYSSTVDGGVRIFGDFFSNYDFVDLDVTPNATRADVSGDVLTLGKSNEVQNILTTAVVSVDTVSNGFSGRNQEILDPSSANINPIDDTLNLTFHAEEFQSNNLDTIIDDDPSTWYEYEHNKVTTEDKVAALNFNFQYQNDIDPAKGDFLDWSSGPNNVRAEEGPQVLTLVLNFDLGSLNKASKITYTPHKVTPLNIHPVRVRRVIVSQDGSNWTEVSDGITWIGTDISLEDISSDESVIIGSAVWQFQETQIRFIRVEIEQTQPYPSNIGHLYYENEPSVTTSLDADGNEVTEYTPGERVEGPIPKLSNIAEYYDPSQHIQNNILQKREFFEGERWTIGIRDISVENVRYQSFSTMISKLFRVDGIVDRVTLESDYAIPSSFPTNEQWVKFYVSPNEGIDWFQISNIKDDNNDVPEVIAFNDPIPTEFREPGVEHHNVSNSVESLLVRIDIERPSDQKSSTPVVKDYRLKVLKR